MRNLLALFALLVLTFTGVGAYRGWYGLAGQPADPGKIAFRVEIDARKLGGDIADLARYLLRGGSSSSKGEDETAQQPQAESAPPAR